MLLILLISIFASVSFKKTAVVKGVDPKKPTRYPWMAALIVLIAGLLFSLLGQLAMEVLHASDNVKGFFSWTANIFFIVVYLAVIARAWKTLKALPDLRAR